ncbi:MAG: hypothetical protein A2499_03635 [Stygiobacter sp. RIFOXYC12_FULL_38_8]|jgi:hypothetical protein|nr:hypothetical protein [Bacteroidota bacterium]MBX2975940.1 hypothetical protein [Ignavibacteriaceae bacterium]OGV13273.1 MAG: hypothetical protein A2440_13175 [Stygiobacter sp. RIFOXYC2_FULL_38_25]OGV30226.1 MAG: hypothetical protein A2499_03635 [Stygiobacter sp. RIFOXYC12_FULL_38_8]OGV83319.1 MAG: hypothetical protein A2X65_16730 [Stygiobacter sp. GWF2_38_21]
MKIYKSNNDELGKNGIRGKYFDYMKNPFKNSILSLIKNTNPFNFICPHCLKTILADKIQGTECPFCDNVNEGCSGLFLPCPKCGGVMPGYICPNPDCGKEIDLLIEYNEEELIRRRYE